MTAKLETLKTASEQAKQSVTAVAAGLGTAAVKTAADFDTGMGKAAAISNATGDDLNTLPDKAREMGRSRIPLYKMPFRVTFPFVRGRDRR